MGAVPVWWVWPPHWALGVGLALVLAAGGVAVRRHHCGTLLCFVLLYCVLRAFVCWQILLPSAVHLEERLTVSQSVPEPASRQSVRYTQFGFFVSGKCGARQQGGPVLQPRPSRVVKQPTGTSLATFAPAPPAAALKFTRPGFEPTPANLDPAALPLDRWPC